MSLYFPGHRGSGAQCEAEVAVAGQEQDRGDQRAGGADSTHSARRAEQQTD